jgi:hypothetical protein
VTFLNKPSAKKWAWIELAGTALGVVWLLEGFELAIRAAGSAAFTR